jgi:hypothetical protein
VNMSVIAGVAGGFLAALIAATPPLIDFYWRNLRLRARQLSAIELATRRLSFWEQFLKVAASASDLGIDKRQSARERAYDAILRIPDYADLELKWLSRDEIQWEQIRGKLPQSMLKFFFAVKPDPSLSAPDRHIWRSYIVLFWFYAIVWLLIALLFVFAGVMAGLHPHPHAPPLALALKRLLVLFVFIALNVFAARMAVHFRLEAEKLKHPRPGRPPVLDRI